jgi:hypothetical protein
MSYGNPPNPLFNQGQFELTIVRHFANTGRAYVEGQSSRCFVESSTLHNFNRHLCYYVVDETALHPSSKYLARLLLIKIEKGVTYLM